MERASHEIGFDVDEMSFERTFFRCRYCGYSFESMVEQNDGDTDTPEKIDPSELNERDIARFISILKEAQEQDALNFSEEKDP